MRPIDLRSDTVTRPTRAMRSSMAEAEVGDSDLWPEGATGSPTRTFVRFVDRSAG